MKKILVFLVIATLMVVANVAATELSKQKLDPQAIIENWTQESGKCYGATKTPDGMRVLHTHGGIFVNPEQNGSPKKVLVYFNPETNEAFFVGWADNNGMEFVYMKYGQTWRQVLPNPPDAHK